jgi:hypothetical protein
MLLEKKPKVENAKQEVKAETDQIENEDSVEDVVMFRVKTALRAGPPSGWC